MEYHDDGKWFWGNLTWSELRDLAASKPVVIQPIGAMEQHGFHLPLNTDNFIVSRICALAGQRSNGRALIMPVIPYAFDAHHMDFPGVIHIHGQHVINYLVDVITSVTHHGLDRVILISGHGVNPPYMAVAGNEVNVKTGALCASLYWGSLVHEVDNILSSVQPGGTAHACELETAVMQYLDPGRVRSDQIADEMLFEQGEYLQMDLRSGTGVHLGEHWWSSFSPSGVAGQPTLGTPDKGEALVEAAVDGLLRLIDELRARPNPAQTRLDLHSSIQ